MHADAGDSPPVRRGRRYNVILEDSEEGMHTFAEIVRGATLAALVLTGRTAVCQEPDKGAGALAAAMRGKHVPLTTALTSLATQGKPISAKYEYEDGKLQLSVYTEKNSQFFEVLLNDRTGKVVKSERITEGEDLDAAKAQSAAMSTVYGPLSASVRKAVRENPGYIAVSAMPSLKNGKAIVAVRLLKGTRFRAVSEPLT